MASITAMPARSTLTDTRSPREHTSCRMGRLAMVGRPREVAVVAQERPHPLPAVAAALTRPRRRRSPSSDFLELNNPVRRPHLPGAADVRSRYARCNHRGNAIEGPWDGEEGITLFADLEAGAIGAMTGGGYPD